MTKRSSQVKVTAREVGFEAETISVIDNGVQDLIDIWINPEVETITPEQVKEIVKSAGKPKQAEYTVFKEAMPEAEIIATFGTDIHEIVMNAEISRREKFRQLLVLGLPVKTIARVFGCRYQQIFGLYNEMRADIPNAVRQAIGFCNDCKHNLYKDESLHKKVGPICDHRNKQAARKA